jgi:predicted nicotinamide N-methyase
LWDLRRGIDDYVGPLAYEGRRVLEFGTASGAVTFALEQRGAEVVSFDLARGR